jgi:2-dehydropantoate 2-reductase
LRFAVLGAGAIGGYVGAALSRAGEDVTLIARGPHLQAMAEHGVHVESPLGDFQAQPAVTSQIAAVADADVVFVGLKAYSLPGLARRLGELMRPDAVAVFAQNGVPWWYFLRHGGELDGRTLESVDPGAAISRAIAPDQVVGCVVYCSTELTGPGRIRHTEGTRFTIGTPAGERTETCRAISGAMTGAGLKSPVDRDLRRQIWVKLIGNVALNPLTTILRSTLGGLAASPHATGYARETMEECAAVAAALAVELPISVEQRLEGGLAVGDHRTSMLQDWDAGKPLETDCMTGAVVEIAGLVDVPVPATTALHGMIKAVEELRDA